MNLVVMVDLYIILVILLRLDLNKLKDTWNTADIWMIRGGRNLYLKIEESTR